jgi:hypothetical protein
MILVSISRVRPAKVDLLRSWMEELNRRADEVRETFRQEGTMHETAYLLECGSDTLLVHVMEAEDPERARRAFERSSLPIDLQHRRVMQEVHGGTVEAEKLLDVRVRPG